MTSANGLERSIQPTVVCPSLWRMSQTNGNSEGAARPCSRGRDNKSATPRRSPVSSGRRRYLLTSALLSLRLRSSAVTVREIVVMAVFVSYSSRDRALLEPLLRALRRAREQVWLDEELSGGEAWWREILDQIRGCEVFVVALSQNLLESRACQAELRYARALGKEILPVQVGPLDNMRINPLAQMHLIDFREPSVDTGIELVSSVRGLRAKAGPLPDPLPEEPPIPFAYLMRLASTISDPSSLSAQQQTTLVAELKAGLEEDGDDASARHDIAQLLAMLRDRTDVTWRTRTEVEAVLAAIEDSRPAPAGGAQTATVTGPPPAAVTGPQPVFASGPPPIYTPPPPGGPPPGYGAGAFGSGGATKPSKPARSNTKWLIAVGGVVAAAIIAVVVVALVTFTGKDPDPVPVEPPVFDRASFGSALLTEAEINSIVGTSDLEATEVIGQMDDTPVTMSNPNCTAVLGTAIESAYADSGYSGVRDQAFSREEPPLWIAQTGVLFPSVDRARDFLSATAERWSRCVGETVTVANETGEQRWIVGELTEEQSQVLQEAMVEAGGGYACQHVLQVEQNVVIEAAVCHADVSDEASRIAESMAAKLPA